MSRASGVFVVLAASASALAACGAGAGVSGSNRSSGPPPAVSATCHPPSPGPTPIAAWLAYPPSGSTGVSVNAGQIIEKGADYPGGGVTIVVSSAAGNVPLGTPTLAPLPYPSPFATAPPTYGFAGPYSSIPMPALSPATTYTVSDTYMDYYPYNPPQCSAPATQFVGTFTTQ